MQRIESYYLKFIFILLFTLSNISHAKDLKIGIVHFEPWGMLVDNQISGIHWEQLQAIFSEADLTASYRLLPIPRAINQLEIGSIDCTIMADSPKTSNAFHMVSSIYNLTAIGISNKNNEINKYSDFINKTPHIGIPYGAEWIFPRLVNDPKANIYTVDSYQQGLTMLVRKHLDAFIGIKTTILYQMKKQHLEESISFPGYKVKNIPVWLVCSKKSTISDDELQKLKSAISRIKGTNAFKTIIIKWEPDFD